MFERFTERAREVVVLAQDEAQNLRHNYIGTEHLLLGLLREEEGLAARVLVSFDVTLEEVRTQVERIIGSGDGVVTGMIPFTPRAKRVLELSLREALRLKHDYIGTEHILLGLARENGGVACQILRDFDVDAESIQAAVAEAVSTRPDASHRQDPRLLLTEGDFDLAGDFAGPAEAFGPPLAPWRSQPALLLAIALAALGFPLGLLVGWLIWS